MEDPHPNRRWFRFSLRTLLVVVTVCALVTWHANRQTFKVIGKLSQIDVAAICALVRENSELNQKPLVRIRAIESGIVEVETGLEDAQGFGHGEMAELEKVGGHWKVTSVTSWVE